jgi:S-ribosylhomocysteine lyase LuxS involved in autoinducer biosynthesis
MMNYQMEDMMFLLVITMITGVNIETISTVPNISSQQCATYKQQIIQEFKKNSEFKFVVTCTKQ